MLGEFVQPRYSMTTITSSPRPLPTMFAEHCQCKYGESTVLNSKRHDIQRLSTQGASQFFKACFVSLSGHERPEVWLQGMPTSVLKDFGGTVRCLSKRRSHGSILACFPKKPRKRCRLAPRPPTTLTPCQSNKSCSSEQVTGDNINQNKW